MSHQLNFSWSLLCSRRSTWIYI